jgi:uncharacterized protein YqgC (DUF456 family)
VDINVDVLIGVLMVLGLIGTVVPLLPGLALIVVAGFVWVVADGSDPGEWIVFGAVAAVAMTGMVIGLVLPARSAAAAGAPRGSLAVGAVGAVIGALVIPFVGALLGWPIGVYLAEWTRTRDASAAWVSTRATAVGLVRGAAVQFGAGLVAVSVWAIAALRW